MPEQVRLAARYAEAIVTDPRAIDGELAAQLCAAFTAAQRVELTLTIALASAFSRTAITWGPPPGMPVMEVPTPEP
ncbi:MAG: hypothetical protein JOZ99_08220 [Actinobacteria bacterium]|nr:hypothetical protein [Actinomycetota bacterium]